MSILYSSLQTAYDEMSGWLHRTVHEESSTRTLGLVRILLGLIALAEHAAEFRLFNRLHAIDLTLSVAFYVSIPMLIIGYRSRFAAFFAGSTLLSSWWLLGEYGGDPQFSAHHVYALALSIFLLCLSPCGRSFSFDRLRAVQHAREQSRPIPKERGLLWATTLHRFQVSMMYFWAAWDKSSLAFGERIEHVYTRLYFGTYEPGAWFSPLMHIGAYGAVLLEYLLPFVLWFSYGRRVFLPVAIAFHLLIYYTLTVGTYTVTMYVLFLLFLPPETIHRIVDTMTARDEKSSH